jgi:hypothetical protein
MKSMLKTGFGLLVCCALLSMTACSNDDDDSSINHEPDHTAGLTDESGTVTLDLAEYDIHVTVMAAGEPAEGVEVELYQGTSIGIVWAEFGDYYSTFQLLDMHSVSGDQNLTLTLVEQGIEYMEWDVDPSLFDLLYSDAAFTEHCAQGSIEDVFTQAQQLGSFVFYRVYGDGADLRDGNIAVGFDMAGMMYNYAAFQEIVFGLFGYIPEDIVEYCWYELTIGEETFVLPTLHIGSIVQQGTPYDYKFILTWGADPRDLDSHLYTPEIDGESYHVYYASSGSAGYAPYAWLDVDDVTSYGPEVITIEELYPGTYSYAIYEYSGDLTLTESEAVVEVYNGRQLIGTYQIPTTPQAGDNWWWHVGDVDGETGAFTLVNTVTDSSPQMIPFTNMPAKIR